MVHLETPLQPLQPWMSAESKTHRWAPETDAQWRPCHLDSHQEKTPGTSGPIKCFQLKIEFLILSFYIIDTLFSYFDIVKLLYYNLYC